MPMNCQTDTSASVVSAYSSFPNQGWNSDFSPTISSIPGAIPQIGDRINFQAKPTTTKLRIVGIKIAVR
jgi:hypothetical protein